MRASRVVIIVAAVLMVITVFAGVSMAEDKIFVKGKILEYDLDEQTVTIKADSGEEMTFVIENDVALFKLDDRLFEGDEVKINYVVENGKKVIKDGSDLKGTKAGC